jgi:hypothetical protein
MVKPGMDQTKKEEFSIPESMSPQSMISLRDMVKELERSGADPTLWVGFCYRGTDWTFLKRSRRPDAD